MSTSHSKTGYFRAVFLPFVLGGAVQSALMEGVSLHVTGTILSVSNPPPDGLSLRVGDPGTGSLAYEPSRGSIPPPPSGRSVVIEGGTVHSAGDASLQGLNDSFGVENVKGVLYTKRQRAHRLT